MLVLLVLLDMQVGVVWCAGSGLVLLSWVGLDLVRCNSGWSEV